MKIVRRIIGAIIIGAWVIGVGLGIYHIGFTYALIYFISCIIIGLILFLGIYLIIS